jgi:hypothetical protein
MKKLLFLILILLYSCNTETTIIEEPCDGDSIIVDQTMFDATDTSNYTITGVSLLNNCLTITLTSSGCDGNSWTASLIDSGLQTASIPPQRHVRLSLTNNETCLAIFERSYTFDINSGHPETVIYNIEGWNIPIVIN